MKQIIISFVVFSDLDGGGGAPLREDLAWTTFLGMYIFGVACAMSEEALFGPFEPGWMLSMRRFARRSRSQWPYS